MPIYESVFPLTNSNIQLTSSSSSSASTAMHGGHLTISTTPARTKTTAQQAPAIALRAPARLALDLEGSKTTLFSSGDDNISTSSAASSNSVSSSSSAAPLSFPNLGSSIDTFAATPQHNLFRSLDGSLFQDEGPFAPSRPFTSIDFRSSSASTSSNNLLSDIDEEAANSEYSDSQVTKRSRDDSTSEDSASQVTKRSREESKSEDSDFLDPFAEMEVREADLDELSEILGLHQMPELAAVLGTPVRAPQAGIDTAAMDIDSPGFIGNTPISDNINPNIFESPLVAQNNQEDPLNTAFILESDEEDGFFGDLFDLS